MKKILLIVVIIMAAMSVDAQIKLFGVVKDSIGDPLEMANVIAIDTLSKKNVFLWFYRCKGKLQIRP